MENLVRQKNNPLSDDLDHILAHTQDLWNEFRNQRIFITGGTGFFGCWLLESLAWANDKLGLNSSALVLTRNPDRFRKKAPHLAAHPAINFHVGDVKDFDFPTGNFSYIVHASNEALDYVKEQNCRLMTNHMIQAAKHVLDFAKICGTKKILFTSSGTVYGPQPPDMTCISEDYTGTRNIDDFRYAHGEGKFKAELLCSEYAKSYNIEAKIARCFSFLGAYLPLDSNYAAGNFIRDGLNGGPIIVKGDGTPYRSYLYAADLMVWLWTILFRGRVSIPYNVGSESSLAIAELAQITASIFHPRPKIYIAKTADPLKQHERYVPSTKLARSELGLKVWVNLPEAIRRTANWNMSRMKKN
jgi:nucleoside-diphosphate-sugar epimerase